jgi:hypothetical protein
MESVAEETGEVGSVVDSAWGNRHAVDVSVA